MGLPRGFISSQITDNSSFLLKDLLSLPVSAAAEVSLSEMLKHTSDLMKVYKMIEIALTIGNGNVARHLQGIVCSFHKEWWFQSVLWK